MTAPAKLNYKVYQGSTFSEVVRWESATKVYKTITNITKAAPMVVTAVGHGMPVGWRAKINTVVGMKEINSSDNYLIATATTTDSITFGDVNSAGYTTYVSGGVLEYNAPTVLTALTARMQIREKLTSATVLATLTTENGGLTLNNINGTITMTIAASATELFTFKSAVYSLEIINGAVVTPLVYGNLTLVSEITR